MGRYVHDEGKMVLNNLVGTIFFDEVIRLGSASPHTLHALLAYVSRARVLHEFYFFAVTSVTRWRNGGKARVQNWAKKGRNGT